jgi:hypothetical protein
MKVHDRRHEPVEQVMCAPSSFRGPGTVGQPGEIRPAVMNPFMTAP